MILLQVFVNTIDAVGKIPTERDTMNSKFLFFCVSFSMMACEDNGHLTVITGPMYSGKTACLIDNIKAARDSGHKVYIYSHSLDYRRNNQLSSRAYPNEKILAFKTDSGADIIMDYFKGECDYVAIDEAQFFKPDLVKYIRLMLECRTKIFVSGLDKNFRGEPFSDTMEQLLDLANTVIRLTATCSVCGGFASMTQRLVNGEPAGRNDDEIVIEGSSDVIKYEPRCRKCYELK
jgi:thymidine kinase